MSAFSSETLDELIASGNLRETGLIELAAGLDGATGLSRSDAEKLVAIHAEVGTKDAGWPDIFIRAVSEHIVHAVEPSGYITVDKAEWLIQQIGRDGRVRTRTELDLLIDVLENVRWAPRSLVVFGLDQVLQAVRQGDGLLRPDEPQVPGQLFDEEIEIMRRLIYAYGSDRCAALTREEAEILFDINDALDGTRINTAWTEFFVKALANVVFAASGYGVPSREEALRAEAWFDGRPEAPAADVIKAIVNSGLDEVLGAYRQQSRVEETLSRLECEYLSIITGEEPVSDDAVWLSERLGRSGTLSPNEIALVSYFGDVEVAVSPALEEVFERVRAAA